jgi:hypothetical protein
LAAQGRRRQLGGGGGGGSGDSRPAVVEAWQRDGSAAVAGRAAAAWRWQVARWQCGNGDGRSALVKVVAARRRQWHGGGTASAAATAWRWWWQIGGSMAGRETAARRRRQLSYVRTTHTPLFFPFCQEGNFLVQFELPPLNRTLKSYLLLAVFFSYRTVLTSGIIFIVIPFAGILAMTVKLHPGVQTHAFFKSILSSSRCPMPPLSSLDKTASS